MDNNEKFFDYENHYKNLISGLTNILIESIEKLPEADKDIPPYSTSYKNKYAESVRNVKY